ncbi:hypothetical protein SEA_HARVEYSR_67 [Mycobacterium phage HarveySr]|uniref:Ribbon-helix-helix DNA binding domain protein n=1 Tax=Mycobacterium phage Tydolla TaxID=2283262 RepID=A0A345MCQ4_9CAUD|nr:hypothetical protein SEA_TYDOLLA_65 [Mycobacterium phage Tydolla]
MLRSMANTRQRATTRTKAENYHLIGIRTRSDDLRRRFRMACAEDGQSGAEMLATLLDLRDDRNRRRRAAMAHPLDTRRTG